mmetsp:Transcript_11712/g.36569  ORF Transcript_11712/g.36569 Transcript_11712/m.36569 type:complete len:216 (-) Transcript_11712:1217-1864(-)
MPGPKLGNLRHWAQNRGHALTHHSRCWLLKLVGQVSHARLFWSTLEHPVQVSYVLFLVLPIYARHLLRKVPHELPAALCCALLPPLAHLLLLVGNSLRLHDAHAVLLIPLRSSLRGALGNGVVRRRQLWLCGQQLVLLASRSLLLWLVPRCRHSRWHRRRDGGRVGLRCRLTLHGGHGGGWCCKRRPHWPVCVMGLTRSHGKRCLGRTARSVPVA